MRGKNRNHISRSTCNLCSRSSPSSLSNQRPRCRML